MNKKINSMKKIFYILAFALSCSFYQSCVNEEEDIFDNTYDTRVNEHCENALNVLTSNPNGWEMLYFLNNELSIPSYTLHIVQRWILVKILNKLLPSDYAMAFRKGEKYGHKQNAYYHAGTLYGLSIDLEDFLGSVAVISG